MNKLLDKMKKSGTIKAGLIKDSSLNEIDYQAITDNPALNIAYSGSPKGGLTPGLTIIAGESRTFKSLMCLKTVSSFLKQNQDGVCLFYDSEFGITDDYLKSMEVDTERLIHIPVTDIEQLTFDLVKRLKDIDKKDNVIIFVDSIGNLASVKEVEDAESGKSVVDMSRAKKLKSLFRIITPHLTLKSIPCMMINHVYKEQGLFPKTIISGGQGILLSANTALVITKSQIKDGKELVGNTFNINIEKSRFVKEKSKIGLKVEFDEGIYKYSGLLDIALESGHIVKPSNGWYQLKNTENKVREKDTGPLLEELLQDETFIAFIEKKYKLSAVEESSDG